jgi:arginyl-tRNA synthetase
MTLRRDLAELFGSAFSQIGLDPGLGDVVPSQRPDLGQFQCNGAMAAAREAKRAPRDIAADVVAIVGADPRIAQLEIAGPGFVNIVVTDEFLAASTADLAGHDHLGVTVLDGEDHWILDYGGPNVAKELHVGHLRTAIIGESIKRTMRYAGARVTGDVHLGDWGVQMGQLLMEVRNEQPELVYFDEDHHGPYPEASPVTIDDLQRLYPLSSSRMKSEPAFAAAARRATVDLQAGRPGYRALWQHFRDVSVEAIGRVYDDLDVSFDVWLGESSVHDRIGPMVERLESSGVAVPSDGAIVVHVSEDDEDHQLPPLMLVKSDGGYAYATTDLATVEERVEDLEGTGAIYVVDARQSLHFEQVFRAARKGGIAPESFVLEHAKIGTVNGLDGTPLRTRDGDLPLLRDLLADIESIAIASMEAKGLAADYPDSERAEIAWLVGMAAVKFGDLSNHRTSSYIFDLERFSSFEGKTGPYLLYVAVRIASLLKKADELDVAPGPILSPSHDSERALLLKISEFADAVERAISLRAPNHVAEYCYELSGAFNRFYEQCHILSEEDEVQRASWLAVAALTRRVVVTSLDLLGITVPERM